MLGTHNHIAQLLFNTPIMMFRPKLEVIVSAISSKIGINLSPPIAPLILPVGALGPRENRAAPYSAYGDSSGIATIEIFGSMVKRSRGMAAESGLTSYESLEQQVMDAGTNPAIGGIFLDLDTCGGSCNGAFDLADLVYEVRKIKPVYGLANDMCLSAGYLIGAACTKLYMTQTGMVGSVGVVAIHCDQSEADSENGLKYTIVTFGDKKAFLSSHVPLSKEADAWLQADVNRLGNKFVAAVAKFRGLDEKLIRDTEAGIFSAESVGTGKSAVDLKFVDGVSTREDVMSMLSDKLEKRANSRGRLPAVNAASENQLQLGSDVSIGQETAPVAEIQNGEVPMSQAAANLPATIPPVPAASQPPAPVNPPQVPAAAVPAAAPAAPAQAPPVTGALVPTAILTGSTTPVAPASVQMAMSAEEMANLNELCAIAGKPAMLSSFLLRNMTFAAAKSELVASRVSEASAGGEINTTVMPNAGTGTEKREPNALRNAVTKLVAKMASNTGGRS